MNDLKTWKYHLISFRTAFSKKYYATPKVRMDVLRFLENSGVEIVDINPDRLDMFEADLIHHKYVATQTKKIFGTLLQYPLKPAINIGSGDSETSFRSLDIIHSLSDFRIVLVHDIKSLQSLMFGKQPSHKHISETIDLERKLFVESDSIITHSEAMSEYISHNFNIPSEKMFSLGLFDYFTNSFSTNHFSKNNTKIAFAGYLGISRKRLLDRLYSDLPRTQNISYNLYGEDFPQERYFRKDIIYQGLFSPEILPEVLFKHNNFGLLWDEFNPLQNKYYKMIVPHKCSLYIRSLLPLIVPTNTYIGDLVSEHKIGVAIGDLSEIATLNISDVSIDFDALSYLQKKLGSGYFTISAVNRALK